MDWRVIHGEVPSLAFAQNAAKETFYGTVHPSAVSSLSNVTNEVLGPGDDDVLEGLDKTKNKIINSVDDVNVTNNVAK